MKTDHYTAHSVPYPGTWSSPTTMGSRPPPCVDFSLTKVDSHRAVVFGGYQPETGTVAETYILNIETWVSVLIILLLLQNLYWLSASIV